MTEIEELEYRIHQLRIDYVITYMLQHGHSQEEIANITNKDLMNVYSTLLIKEKMSDWNWD